MSLTTHRSGFGGGKKVALTRKPSPTREENDGAEQTFQQKLDEIKRSRIGAVPKGPDPIPKCPPSQGNVIKDEGQRVLTVTGYKTFLKSFNDWVEVVSKSGKVYYYNKRSLVNQWKKPDDWVKEEDKLNAPPPLPPTEPYLPPLPESNPPPPPPPADDKLKLKLKLKPKKKIKKQVKNPDGHLPVAYQKNGKRTVDSSSEDEDSKKPKMTIDNAFEDPDIANEGQKLAKLDPGDEIGHLKLGEVDQSENDNLESDISNGKPVPESDDPSKDCRKFDPRVSGPERAENLVVGCAAALAFKNITSLPEASALYGENPLPPPPSLNLTGNPTYFSDYNLPCCLKRCKFPKEQDVLHELKINKQKRRTFQPPPVPPGLDSKLAHMAKEAEMEQFFVEIKNYNNHDRLLTNRMNEVLVYKIPDEVWERYFHLFQIKIFDGVYLECKPSGYTNNDELIYSRTGKICGHKTFPEDEVRCQAVLQSWNKDYCLCMYANRVFKIKRDDDLWDDDLYECRKFLERNGY